MMLEESTALNVKHTYITNNWSKMVDLIYTSILNNDKKKISQMVNFLVDLAEAKTLQDGWTYKKGKEMDKKAGGCWRAGPSGPCLSHMAEFVNYYFIGYMIGSVSLRDYMNEKEFKII